MRGFGLRLIALVKAAGYKGHIGIEFEGNTQPEDESIRKTKALPEKYLESRMQGRSRVDARTETTARCWLGRQAAVPAGSFDSRDRGSAFPFHLLLKPLLL
ncbi:MAG TPA: hypothetical protein VLI39_03250 [Sedimentisphaerales bacterium]|nr:hypothetical protein [Sedimentisphaerales bacterium]